MLPAVWDTPPCSLSPSARTSLSTSAARSGFLGGAAPGEAEQSRAGSPQDAVIPPRLCLWEVGPGAGPCCGLPHRRAVHSAVLRTDRCKQCPGRLWLRRTPSMTNPGTKGSFLSQPMVKSVLVYRNGDPFFPGRRIVINEKKVSNFEVFLKEVTGGVKAPFGAVRNIYTPRAGHRVRQLEELQSGEQYVAGGREAFKKLK